MGWLAQRWCHRARPVHLAAFEGVPLVLNFLLFHISSLRCIYSNPQKAWLKNIGVDKIPQKSWSILRSTCYKWRGSFSPTRKKLRISIFLRGCERPTGWWFGTFFIFPNSWDDDPILLIFSEWLKPPTRTHFKLLQFSISRLHSPAEVSRSSVSNAPFSTWRTSLGRMTGTLP